MLKRKELKRRGRRSLWEHYLIFVAVCLIASFISAEFTDSLTFSELRISSSEEAAAEGLPSDAISTSERRVEFSDVLEDLLSGNLEGGREKSQELLEAERGEETPILGRTQGVLSKIVNQISSGSILVTIAAAAGSVTGSESLGLALVILAGLLVFFTFWYLVQNLYVVISRRIFLEGRCYEKVPLQRFVYLFRIRKWLKTAWTMFVTWLYQFLWSLTIIGGIIKHYSYFLVPYIVAENPDIPTRKAIRLSRRMMKGHKWQCFLFELSFLGWDILGLITLGLSNVFYKNPYQVAAFSEYYAELRRLAWENQIPDVEYLNDWYLFERPSWEVMEEAYQDVIEIMEGPEETLDHLTGWRGFLARNFGILILRTKKERDYEEHQAARIRVDDLVEAVEGKIYPTRLYPIPEEQRRPMIETLHYVRHYTIWSLILMFFIFSFIGWLWEVSLHLITDGVFVNRGVMHGPWLPIYGTGGVLILTLLNRFRKKPLMEFIATVVMCGVLEYFTSYFLELMTGGTRWWDYSGYFLNLHGRICAEGLLVFGVGGLAIVYVLAPLLDNAIGRIPEKKLAVICAVLVIAFSADALYSQKHPNSGEGITAKIDSPLLPGQISGQQRAALPAVRQSTHGRIRYSAPTERLISRHRSSSSGVRVVSTVVNTTLGT